MSKLAALVVPTATVKLSSGGELVVRGLSTTDIQRITARHTRVVEALVGTFFDKDNQAKTIAEALAIASSKVSESGVMGILSGAPDLVNDIVLCGLEEFDNEEVRKDLERAPIGIISELLVKTLEVTLADGESAKKFIGIVGAAMVKASPSQEV